jgi:hypothetical protein
VGGVDGFTARSSKKHLTGLGNQFRSQLVVKDADKSGKTKLTAIPPAVATI